MVLPVNYLNISLWNIGIHKKKTIMNQSMKVCTSQGTEYDNCLGLCKCAPYDMGFPPSIQHFVKTEISESSRVYKLLTNLKRGVLNLAFFIVANMAKT